MTTLVLPAEVTQQQATVCLRMLLSGLSANPEPSIVVDANALRKFDTTTLAVLLECRRTALAAGKTFVVHGLPAALMGMAGLYGVDELLVPAGLL